MHTGKTHVTVDQFDTNFAPATPWVFEMGFFSKKEEKPTPNPYVVSFKGSSRDGATTGFGSYADNVDHNNSTMIYQGDISILHRAVVDQSFLGTLLRT